MKRLLEKAKEAKTELEITPMIDVVFLLLIFFMCATKFKIPEGTLRSFLPRDRGEGSSQPVYQLNCRVTLGKTPNGTVVVIADEKPMPPASVLDEYEQRSRQPGFNEKVLEDHLLFKKSSYTGLGEKGLPVIIDFQKEVPYKYVVQVLNICRRVQIEDISFAMPEIPLDSQ